MQSQHTSLPGNIQEPDSYIHWLLIIFRWSVWRSDYLFLLKVNGFFLCFCLLKFSTPFQFPLLYFDLPVCHKTSIALSYSKKIVAVLFICFSNHSNIIQISPIFATSAPHFPNGSALLPHTLLPEHLSLAITPHFTPVASITSGKVPTSHHQLPPVPFPTTCPPEHLRHDSTPDPCSYFQLPKIHSAGLLIAISCMEDTSCLACALVCDNTGT